MELFFGIMKLPKVWRAKVLGKENGCKLNFTSCSKVFKSPMSSKSYPAYPASSIQYPAYLSYPAYPACLPSPLLTNYRFPEMNPPFSKFFKKFFKRMAEWCERVFNCNRHRIINDSRNQFIAF